MQASSKHRGSSWFYPDQPASRFSKSLSSSFQSPHSAYRALILWRFRTRRGPGCSFAPDQRFLIKGLNIKITLTVKLYFVIFDGGRSQSGLVNLLGEVTEARDGGFFVLLGEGSCKWDPNYGTSHEAMSAGCFHESLLHFIG